MGYKMNNAEAELQNALKNTVASFAFEDMEISEEEQQQMLAVARGEMTREEYVRLVLRESGD